MYVKQARENYIPPRAGVLQAASLPHVLTSLSLSAAVDNFGGMGSAVDEYGLGGSSVGNWDAGGSSAVGDFANGGTSGTTSGAQGFENGGSL